jgi:hypothetical protein
VGTSPHRHTVALARDVRLVLVDVDRAVLGELPWFEVASPWWPDVEPVVGEAKARFDVDIDVLRLVDVVGSDPAGARNGRVTYEAQLLGGCPTDLRQTEVELGGDHARRAPWARPGGVRALVAWADGFVDRTGPAEQAKSWNLSCVIRLPTTKGTVWCKAVPPFFAHEGAILRLAAGVRPDLVPPVLAFTPGVALLGHVEGVDQWEAGPKTAMAMVEAFVDLQQALTVDQLRAAGLPDWRSPALLEACRNLCRRHDVRATLGCDELPALDVLVDGLPDRFAALDECGIEPTLVHGDFHPGNWRARPGQLVLLDWGDSGIGHPLLDMPAFLERMSPESASAVRSRWITLLAGSAERAGALIAPIADLRQALIYRTFLDGIEPAEHRYHAGDVPNWLRAAVTSAGLRP